MNIKDLNNLYSIVDAQELFFKAVSDNEDVLIADEELEKFVN